MTEPNITSALNFKLQEFQNIFNIMFDQLPVGVAIFDLNYNIINFNDAWAEFSKTYAPADAINIAIGANYFKVLPGSEPSSMPLFTRVENGETIKIEGYEFVTGGKTSYWDSNLSPIYENNKVVGILNITSDATERVLLQKTLQENIETRTKELEQKNKIAESLHDIISMINSDISLEELLDKSVELAAKRLNAAACIMHAFNFPKGEMTNQAAYGTKGIINKGNSEPFEKMRIYGADGYLNACLENKPLWDNYPPFTQGILEIINNQEIPDDIKELRIKIRKNFSASFSVPLFIQNQPYGGMIFYYTEPQDFKPDQIKLGLTFAEQVAVAIENARLHQQDIERQRDLQLLLDVSETANNSLKLRGTLSQTLDVVVKLLNATRVGVGLIDQKTGDFFSFILRPEQQIAKLEMNKIIHASWQVIKSGKMQYIAPDDKKGFFEPGALIPLKVHGKNLGILVIIGEKGNEFSESQLNLFRSIADQLSISIENAQLFEKAEENAVIAERNRLARDLHDAVTQTLFSSSIIAEVIPKLWDKNPDEAMKRLEELRTLTKGALSEMRTLLVELRPSALKDSELGYLIRHQVNAFSTRTKTVMDFDCICGQNPSVEIKEVVYYIVQEALNNINKHAQADNVILKLNANKERVELNIKDNGKGFDMQNETIDGLGLGIMKERADSIDAELYITSQPGKGTLIYLTWHSRQQGEI